MDSDRSESPRDIEREMEEEAGRMQRHLDELDERVDDAEKKAKESRERIAGPADEAVETVAGDASERTTSSDDPTSAVGNPENATEA
jgi:hypothetical protein